MRTAAHSNNFDFVRLCAALCVVVSHQFALTGLKEPVVLDVHSLGGLGVLIFFSVSGFLVTQSWTADPHLGRFAARRLLRIWPGLAVVVLLAALVWGPLVSHLSWKEYIHHPAFRDYFSILRFSIRDTLPLRLEGNALPLAVNGPLWTIPLELKCYVVLACLGVAGLLRQKWVAIAITVLLVGRYAVLEVRGDNLSAWMGWEAPEKRFLLEFGLFFAAGVVLHFLRPASRRQALLMLAGCWIAGLASIALGHRLLGLWFIIPATTILFGCASFRGFRDAGRYGDLSYGLYIYSFPVQQTLVWLLGRSLGWTPLFMLTLLVASLCAFLSWHCVEKWALTFKPRTPRAAQPETRLPGDAAAPAGAAPT